jgi:hypothetical protein
MPSQGKGMENNDNDIRMKISTAFMVSVLLYSFEALNWEDLSTDQKADKVKEWADKQADNLILALKKSGYSVVPVEPIPDAFLK